MEGQFRIFSVTPPHTFVTLFYTIRAFATGRLLKVLGFL